MGFSIERSASVSDVRIVDRLVVGDRAELRVALLGELADGVRTLRFDFADAGYIDAAALGFLVSISRRAREHSAEVILANLNEDLRTLFMLTKLDSQLTIEGEGDEGTSAHPADLPPRPSGPSRPAVGEDRPRP
jgi:anti-sigma B factor antagonist